MNLNCAFRSDIFAAVRQKTDMKKLIENFEMENAAYASPMMAVLEISPEGVLCGSGTEDIEFLDGEW